VDERKAATNLKKHGVSFQDAGTSLVIRWRSLSMIPIILELSSGFLHSFGLSRSDRLLVVAHIDRGRKTQIISACMMPSPREKSMKKARRDELRPEYRREDLGKGVRGKHLKAYRTGTSLVLLRPEVAAAFHSARAVNDALSSLVEVAEHAGITRRSTGRTKTVRRSRRALAGLRRGPRNNRTDARGATEFQHIREGQLWAQAA
jgi:uncharacterized DUF497 family protein